MGVVRVDHGVRATEDKMLIQRLQREQMPLTICPLSNTRLRSIAILGEHPILTLLDQGLKVTVNSDDPGLFWRLYDREFPGIRDGLGMTDAQAQVLARNGFEAALV